MAEKKQPEIRFKGFSDDWEQRELGDIADIVRGASPRPIKDPKWFDDKSDIGWLRISDVTEQDGRIHHLEQHISKAGQENTRVLIEPHLLLSIAATVGKPVINYIKTGVHDGFLIFQNPRFDREFMFQWLEMFRPKWQKFGQPGSQVNLNSDLVKSKEIMLPNESEQAQIGSLFANLDNLIALHQLKYEKLQNFKKAMLEKMFPKDGANVPEIRFKGFTDAWEKRKVGDLTNVASAARVHKEEWASSGIPFFRSSDVVSAYKGTENEKVFISCELYEQLAKVSGKLEKDDILITGGGSIGIPYIMTNNEPLYSKDADLIWVKNSEKFNSQYLYTYFISPEFRKYLSGISHIGTIAHYTIEQVKETPICLPSIHEQNMIGSYFMQLDNLITLQQRELEKLQNIKKALLDKMFV